MILSLIIQNKAGGRWGRAGGVEVLSRVSLPRDYWGRALNEEGKGLSGRKNYKWKRPKSGSSGLGKLFHPSNSSLLLFPAVKSVSFAS